MLACYDLSRCPPTYDAVAFLALVELERLRTGADHVDVRILPGPIGGFRHDSLWPRTLEERLYLRDEVLYPLCRMLPSARTVEPGSLGLAGWGRGEYLIGLPRIMEALRAGCRPLRFSGEPAQRLITFTLREAEHHPLRNSRTAEWVAAAGELRRRGWRVVVIRDTLRASEPLEGAETLPRASLHLGHRALWYATATLNVGISNGPMWMSIFMDAPTLMLRPTTNAAGGCYDDAFYARHGLRRGDQLPTSPTHQRLAWREDTSDEIVRAVEEMVG